MYAIKCSNINVYAIKLYQPNTMYLFIISSFILFYIFIINFVSFNLSNEYISGYSRYIKMLHNVVRIMIGFSVI